MIGQQMALIPPQDANIQEFWSWFKRIAGRLAENFENEQLLEELDARVSKLGEITWELGPGTSAENALVLSPDGAVEWLPITRRVVSMAPEIVGWEFHSARPAKQWTLEFSIESTDGTILDVDARAWRYVLFRLSDGNFDIVLEQTGSQNLRNDDDRYAAAVVALDGVLGEAQRLSRIRDIEPVASLPSEHAGKVNALTVLSQHMGSLLH